MSGEPAFSLTALGWGEPFATAFASLLDEAGEALVPARVVGQQGSYRVATGEAELPAEPAGKLRREPGGLPAVGDWVALEPPATAGGGGGSARIQAVLPRRSRFSRKVAGNQGGEVGHHGTAFRPALSQRECSACPRR
jgi:ribosome biogenesis GTPase / thiamine phosphate phosphatase